jgi:hypothetical protein
MVEQPGRERPPEQSREPLGERTSTSDARSTDGRSNSAVREPTVWRPGLITFAALMMFALGGFHILVAISEFANSTWVLSRLDIELFIPILLIWGILDLIIGAIALYAGFSTLRGGTFGWVMGATFAVLGIIRWLFYIPVTPVLAVVVIVLDMLVIYALVQHSDYFQSSRSA